MSQPQGPEPTPISSSSPNPVGIGVPGTDGQNRGMNRRGFYATAANILGGLTALAVAIPGIGYLLDPLFRNASEGGFRRLPTSLGELPVGVPRQFPIVDRSRDAWVSYPPEPIGSVWLVRQPEGTEPPLIAFSAECPHLGCAVNLSPDGDQFVCPCHTSAFALDGDRLNSVPPRPLDRLDVQIPDDPNGPILVDYQRFQTQTEAKVPLV